MWLARRNTHFSPLAVSIYTTRWTYWKSLNSINYNVVISASLRSLFSPHLTALQRSVWRILKRCGHFETCILVWRLNSTRFPTDAWWFGDWRLQRQLQPPRYFSLLITTRFLTRPHSVPCQIHVEFLRSIAVRSSFCDRVTWQVTAPWSILIRVFITWLRLVLHSAALYGCRLFCYNNF